MLGVGRIVDRQAHGSVDFAQDATLDGFSLVKSLACNHARRYLLTWVVQLPNQGQDVIIADGVCA